MNPFFYKIIQLSDVSFGHGYLTLSELCEYSLNTKSSIIINTHKGELLGFSIVQLLTIEQLKKEIFADSKWIEKEFGNASLVGYRKMTAVSKIHQGKGVASQLYQKADKWFSGKTNAIASALWTKEGNSSFSPILIKNGFEPLKTIQNYWKEDSENREFVCPSCGHPPCLCSAVIYRKTIE